MKKIFLAIAIVLIGLPAAQANEGMWLPLLIKRLNYVDMQKHGLKLTAEEIYSVNNSSLKDAIVALGGGFCTGEIISSEGLMLTNHHCGYDAIQSNSTPENNILQDGFWAMSKDKEIPIPGLTVWFLHSMDDVTAKVLDGVTDDMNASARGQKIAENKEQILKEEGDKYHIDIKEFFEGNEYYIFRYNIFKDVRLVGTPPESIGKFGGDTDNWMWPRHTGDFSMFRVYANSDNEPADYSSDNKPYNPKHHLPISLNGVKEGDYAMIMGYPGSTDRYLTSYGVKEAVEISQPARVKVRRKKLDIIEKGQNADPAVRLQYASKHARIANYWKYFLGQSQQLVNNKVWQKKKKIEDDFQAWANSSAERRNKYGNVIQGFKEGYESGEDYVIPHVYFYEAVLGVETFGFAFQNCGLNSKLHAILSEEEIDEQKLEDVKKEILANADAHFEGLNIDIEKELFASMMKMYVNDVDPEFHPELLTELNKKAKGNWQKLVDKYFAKSPYASKENLAAWLDKISLKALEKDMATSLMNAFVSTYRNKVALGKFGAEAKMQTSKRLFIDGLRKMNPDKAYAPDANSTMRVTYGQVLAYDARDGVRYKNKTTLAGVMEKEVDTDNKSHEFYVHQKLKDLYEEKDYGQYGEDGTLYVCFLTNNDITGGNSGSPVINGKGELIGCAFDGNWEAMSGDIYFEPNIQRTISVDIRYVLFVIDKYSGAKHLIDEMTLVKSPTEASNKKMVDPANVKGIDPQN